MRHVTIPIAEAAQRLRGLVQHVLSLIAPSPIIRGLIASRLWGIKRYTLYAMRKTYQGSCHCGRVRFEVDADLDHVRVCDCSICRKRGALIHRVPPSCFRLLTPIEDLSLYQWHTMVAKDYFCPTCGILPFRRPRTTEDVWGINVRCLDRVELSSIPTRQIYGSRLD